MRKFLLKLLMGASLTTSVFIFQACYGTPYPDVEVPRSQTQLQDAVPESQTVTSQEEEELETGVEEEKNEALD